METPTPRVKFFQQSGDSHASNAGIDHILPASVMTQLRK
jgi:hypothetical protein